MYIKKDIKSQYEFLNLNFSCSFLIAIRDITTINNKLMEFYLSSETTQRSKFKNVKVGDHINLELPLKFGNKISGHICQGHVDCTSKLSSIKKIDKSYLFEFNIARKERKKLVEKASISINGISLTISKKTPKGFQVWVIPHSLKPVSYTHLTLPTNREV